jgi:hypothetical protein
MKCCGGLEIELHLFVVIWHQFICVLICVCKGDKCTIQVWQKMRNLEYCSTTYFGQFLTADEKRDSSSTTCLENSLFLSTKIPAKIQFYKTVNIFFGIFPS